MSILTIIPARSGSKRLPGKNWEVAGGMTLVARTAYQAKGLSERMVFVTDAPERCYGAGADVLKEPLELAGDDVPMSSVVQWACAQMQPADAVLVLQPTSPLRTAGDIKSCVNIMFRTPYRPDSVVSVTYDLATKGYRRNGAIYLTRWELAARGELMGGWTQFYVMPPERSIDINTAEDLAEARRLAGDG